MNRIYEDTFMFGYLEALERAGQNRLEGCLRVEGANMTANIYLRHGSVISAESEGKTGLEALEHSFNSINPKLKWFESAGPKSENLNLQLMAYLMERHVQYDQDQHHEKMLKKARQSGVLGACAVANTSKLLSQREFKESPHFLDCANGGERIAVRRMACLVGREATCDITLVDLTVSRRHALVRITNRGLHLTDLGSTNGTRVNGNSIQEGFLSTGDEVAFGSVKVKVVEDQHGARALSERRDIEPGRGPILNPVDTSHLYQYAANLPG